ncbi:MAG: hypothetical protein JWO71_3004 [Candidatus Acidoferrum typicum]|nr:hypothetical protein [Candidatus Acidoferrum typicum]
MSGGDGSGGPEPLLHLVVTYDARLLHYHAATIEDDKVGYTAHVVTFGELRIFFCVDLYHYGFAGHVGSGARDFRSGGATRAAPISPEIYEYGNRRVPNNFVELHIVDRQGLSDGWQGRFASSATASAGEILGGDPIFLSAISATANDRHTGPPSH